LQIAGMRIHITGIVQGVGFRPFIYSLAMRKNLNGWVRNTSAGVDIAVDGPEDLLNAFVADIRKDAPPLAQIDNVTIKQCPPDGFQTFEIVHSQAIPDAFIPISPDISICQDCLRELFDPTDRRYRYPFINCTNCGPRFTIIEDIPYDRPKTTMKDFPMCRDCAGEYQDPEDRRFHAQPVACPECGPQVWLELNHTAGPSPSGEAAIAAAQALLVSGQILAIKGLGGFHLACDATNPAAVSELRQRKLRVDKPFALMMPDIDTIKLHCYLDDNEQKLLESRERPIVILFRKPESTVARQVSPSQNTLGIMLPYTPLHYLLFSMSGNPSGGRRFDALVMTSGNLSEEPIAIDNNEARTRLARLADAFLMHNRPIRLRCDDSVARVFHRSLASNDEPSGNHRSLPGIIRRSRGYAPTPIRLPWKGSPVLATGSELKNTVCLTRDDYAILSQHIGDLENYETYQSFEDSIDHLQKLFRIKPEAIAYDLHPNYLATRYALERAAREDIPAIGVQHHHAHVAACMAEHRLTGNQMVIGVSFDGTGYGDDQAIWGSEFLLANYTSYLRLAHLVYFPLPGGDSSIRKPARTALAYLWQAGLAWDETLPPVRSLNLDERRILQSQLENHINSPLTSSMGRLFDVVAALTGIRQTINYEAQAAIELEANTDPEETGAYEFTINSSETSADNLPIIPGEQRKSTFKSFLIDPEPLIREVTKDLKSGVPNPIISARFHNGVAAMVRQVALEIREQFAINQVALSGGVWQNAILSIKTITLLEREGFQILTHQQVPTNDGGIALGQAVVGLRTLISGERLCA
jgi:hydrogenase maturation protein HypF